jgi:hypothetical protein
MVKNEEFFYCLLKHWVVDGFDSKQTDKIERNSTRLSPAQMNALYEHVKTEVALYLKEWEEEFYPGPSPSQRVGRGVHAGGEVQTTTQGLQVKSEY